MVLRLVWAVLTLGLAAVAVWAASHYVRELHSDTSLLAFLHSPPASARDKGVVHGRARLVQPRDVDVLACAAEYKSGKSWTFVSTHDDLELELEDRSRYRVSKATQLNYDDLPKGSRASAQQIAQVRSRFEALQGDRVAVISCLTPEEPVYILGCADPGQGELRACSGESGVLVSTRGFEAMVRTRAANAATWLALAAVALALCVLFLWVPESYPRPIVGSLWRHARATARSRPGIDRIVLILGAVGLIVSIALVAVRGDSGKYVVTLVAVFAPAGLAAALVMLRFRRLSAALRVLRDMPAGALDAKGAELRELAVRVAADAPTLPEIEGHRDLAFVRLTISETVRVKEAKRTTETTTVVAEVASPRWMPIEDASGRALLDMTHCELDAFQPKPITATTELPAWVLEAAGRPITASENHAGFNVQWMKLAPGDPLLLFGTVERLPPDAARDAQLPSAVEGYRGGGTILGVRGATIAHAGSKAALTRFLRRERFVIVPLVAVLVAATLATVAATVFASVQA